MARVSPLISAFNGGEWSPLMEGRVTHERYKTALRVSTNFAGLAQGPAIRRSGSRWTAPQYDHATPGRMVEFEFSVLDTFMLGFEDLRIRFMQASGLLLHAAVAVTALVSLSPFRITVPGHGCSANDEVFFGSFPSVCRLFQGFGVVTSVVGDDLIFAGLNAAGYSFAAGQTVARVHHITTPYTSAKLSTLRHVQSTDTLYLFEGTVRSQVLTRNAIYDWPIRNFKFEDGPYLPVNDTPTLLTPTSTGNAIVAFNPANATGGTNPDDAFDGDAASVWTGVGVQNGFVQYDFGAPTPLRGYTIVGPLSSSDDAHPAADFNPSSWTLLGSANGVDFTELDRYDGYVLYTGKRSAFFRFKSEPNFRYYRLQVLECVGNGTINPQVAELRFTPAQSQASSSITFNASSTTGINRGLGFLSTDVGRVLRFKANDNFWRWYTITAVNSTTQIVCKQESDALPGLVGSAEWRLGLFSDTTGWPTCGYFYEDRLVIGGGVQHPDTVAASVPGGYERFSPSDPDGTVTEASSWVAVLNGRKVGAVTWIEGDSRGLVVGTINGPWTIRSTDAQRSLTVATAKAKPLPRRACATAEAVAIDNQILFLPRSRRILRELAYDYNADGYQAPSVSLFASHLGASRFVRMAYAAEPHSIVWLVREDGLLLGFTYNPEEQVFGWHRHPMTNGIVEDVAVRSGADGALDEVWVQVRRTIEGQTRRFYEVLQPFADFTTTLDNGWYVDCGFEYQGAPATVIGGLWPLEGQTVSIIADGVPITPQVVVNGTITLPFEASRVVVGLGYDSYGETMRPEAGAADGTAQGDIMRTHRAKLRLWNTLGGEIGPVGNLQELPYGAPEHEPGARLELFSGDFGPIDFPDGYDDGVIAFRQPGSNPLPFNVVAIMPKTVVQEGG